MLDEYGNLIAADKDKERVIKTLETGNINLDSVTQKYFASKISKSHLGEDNFKSVEYYFNIILREYSIVDSRVIECFEHPSQSKLLELNNIPAEIFQQYTGKVDDILQSYTDKYFSNEKKEEMLYKQISKLIYNFDTEENIRKNINKSLQGNYKKKYLRNVLLQMSSAGVNQMINEDYIVIDKLFNTYKRIMIHLKTLDFKEKKKHLQRVSTDKGVDTLYRYIEKFKEANYEKSDSLEQIRFFFFFLIYGANKIDIFMIHSILGYKYDEATEFYKKLFKKDKSTGKNEYFLYHTDILNIGLESLYQGSTLYKQILETMEKRNF